MKRIPSPIGNDPPRHAAVHAAVELWRFGGSNVFEEDLPPPPPAPPPEPGATFDNSRELAGLVEMSLTSLREILSVPLPGAGDIDAWCAMARVHLSATEKVLNTQLRADDNVLKRRAISAMPKILRDLSEMEGRVPLTIEAQAAE